MPGAPIFHREVLWRDVGGLAGTRLETLTVHSRLHDGSLILPKPCRKISDLQWHILFEDGAKIANVTSRRSSYPC
jgi:hypothetical protein